MKRTSTSPTSSRGRSRRGVGEGRTRRPSPAFEDKVLPDPTHHRRLRPAGMSHMRPAQGISVLRSPAAAKVGALAAFTFRDGGVSEGPYRSLNLGTRTGDEAERVAENRRRLQEELGVPAPAIGGQVHGAVVAEAGPGSGEIAGADALFTTSPGVPVAILVADCLPILMVSPGGLVAVHAGWRGLAAGILGSALERLDPTDAVAVIGPAIGPCHYEVGEEVVTAVDRGTGGRAMSEVRSGRPFLDLAGTAEGFLRSAGVGEVEVDGTCTACRPDLLFSHRRDGTTGRQALVAMLITDTYRKQG